MTITPVMDVSLVPGTVNIAASGRGAGQSDFQSVWNSRGETKTDKVSAQNDARATKTPGESMKARDEHRARTQKREPSRDVEERTDIPQEKQAELLDRLEELAVQLVQQLAEVLGKSPEEVQQLLGQSGIQPLELLEGNKLGEVLLKLSGQNDFSAFVTEEGLYADYREMAKLLEEGLEKVSDANRLSMEDVSAVLHENLEKLHSPNKQGSAMQGILLNQDRAEGDMVLTPAESEKIGNVTDYKPADMRNRDEWNTEEMNTGEIQLKGKTVDDASAKSDSGKEHHSGEENKGELNNLFLQNLRQESIVSETEQIGMPETSWTPETKEIMNQIMDYMKLNLQKDVTSMEMQLHPASLGTVQIHVAAKDGVVTANFITRDETVKAVLEGQMIQLKEQFAEQGIKVEAIEVTVQTHQFEQNLEQGRGRGRGYEPEPSKKGRIRRINLNDSLQADGVEQEESLVREMMMANGNTVDYTA